MVGDAELIFWIVLGVLSIIGLIIVACIPSDLYVSQDTIKRACGERTH